MKKYLVGIMYHDPKSWELWNAGIVEDYESITGIFILADTEDSAILWASYIADKLFIKTNPNENKSWKSFGYTCWIEHDLQKSYWTHCFDFFQCVKVNEMPNLDLMGTDAYIKWEKKNLKTSVAIDDSHSSLNLNIKTSFWSNLKKWIK